MLGEREEEGARTEAWGLLLDVLSRAGPSPASLKRHCGCELEAGLQSCAPGGGRGCWVLECTRLRTPPGCRPASLLSQPPIPEAGTWLRPARTCPV